MSKLKILRLLGFLVFVLYFFISGCDSRFLNKDKVVYSSMYGLDASFNLNELHYSIGDVVGSIEDCSSPQFPLCIIFDSTAIMIPEGNVFDKIQDGHYEGRNERLNLDYTLQKTEFTVLGQKITGYLFQVAHPHEIISGKPMLDKLKGAYFYSMSNGILFFEHNSEIIFTDQEKHRSSVMKWSVSGCGFFSVDCDDT